MPERETVAQWLRERLATRDISLTRLPGATSSTLFKVDTPDCAYVLRLFEASQWLEAVNDLPGREAHILQALAGSSVSTPRFIASAAADSAIGAAILMSWLPGQVQLPPAPRANWLATLAGALACIHAAPLEALPWQYASWQHMTGVSAPGWFEDDGLWRSVQRRVTAPPEIGEQSFLHRDYHPVNVLWEGSAISGVVDWVNACMGPRGVDVAHCRLNLVLMYGVAAANGFLQAYCKAAPGYRHDPYWDIDAALAWFPEPTSYPPWAEFGLGAIARPLLIERIREFLQEVTTP